MRKLTPFALLLALAFSLLHGAAARAEAPRELWLYYPTNLLVDENITKLEEVWARAAKAGYTHVLLGDSKFAHLGDLDKHYFDNAERAKQVAKKLNLTLVPALFSVGYSNDLLHSDPNLAEGVPVKDSLFEASGGVLKLVPDPEVNFGKLSFKDDTVSDPGAGVVTVSPGGSGVARFVYHLKLPKYRCYHVSVKVKTDDYHGHPEIKALADNWDLQNQNLGVKPTQDWTRHDVVFDTLNHDEVNVYFGDWSHPAKGSLQWKDWKIEEAPLVNVIRRPGTPVTIKTEDGRTLAEGKDVDRIVDPKMGTTPWVGEYQSWHEPPVIKTKLKDGTRVRVSWYYPPIVYDGQVAACIAEPKTKELLADEAKRMKALFGTPGYMMSHDEFRVFGWDESCRATHKTPGQKLADNVKECRDLLRPATAYVWNDMFDPFHNAVPGPYYLVNGPWTDSWKGLDKDVVIVNWNYGKRDESLKFFADRGNRQVIAGYYDADHDTKKWLESASKVKGVVGIMYTTWRNDYSNIEAFARECRRK